MFTQAFYVHFLFRFGLVESGHVFIS